MPLGSPPVTQLRSMELREVAVRIDAIRQRLLGLDAEVTRLGSVADATSLGPQVAALARALTTLTQRVSALESAIGAADTITLAASSPVALYDVVVPSSPNQCATADPNDPTLIHAALGIAITASGAGSPITIQRGGPLTLPGGGLEPGRPVYAGPGGEITQETAYVAAVIPVGVATGTSTIWVSPELALLRQQSIYPDPFELAMPVTLALLLERIAALDELFEGPDGIVVKANGTLVSRMLLAGSGTGIVIDNGDGVDGDPMFALESP
jgi:hypothetical protein